MGGGKNTYSRASEAGQMADYQTANMANQMYNQTQPLRQGFFDEWNQMNATGNPSAAMNTGYGVLRNPSESQYNVARQNVIGSNPKGGGLFDQLTNVETSRANSLSQVMANLYQDERNKIYGTAMGEPQVSMSGLGNVMQYGTGAMGTAEQGAQARSSFCCFIFCATDPNDELLEYVRKYKDSHYDIDSNVAQGYKRLALWLVPSMRKHKVIKRIIKTVMVHPMELYAKAHYEENYVLKLILSPIAHFWTFVYSIIGNYYGLRGWMKYWRLIDRW
jgi:hypothetical protein